MMTTHYKNRNRSRQRGMGATVILFTIALIVLVGAALAYASRGNSASTSVESARVYSAVLLKQSAEYRDAYNRFVFDGGNIATMTFNTTATTGLFEPAKQYGVLQTAPAAALTTGAPIAWQYNAAAIVTGIGTTAPESVTYLPNVTAAVCAQINNQMYGSATIPALGIALAALGTASTPFDTAGVADGRATGCVVTSDGTNVFYSTLGEA